MARLKILLVEDDLSTMRALERLISLLGHEVVTAYDGEEAILRFDSEEWLDVVITDTQMGPKSGIYFLRYLKRQAIERWLPVLIHSGEYTFFEQGGERAIDLEKDLPAIYPLARFHIKNEGGNDYLREFLDEVSATKTK